MSPSKPTLYIELDGPLVIPAAEDADPVLNGAIVPYGRSFMHWANDRYKVVCLTDRDLSRAHRALQLMDLDKKSIPVHGYTNTKTSLIDPKSNFYWIDSILTPNEISWIGEHDVAHRVQTVHPETGITEEHKKLLENKHG